MFRKRQSSSDTAEGDTGSHRVLWVHRRQWSKVNGRTTRWHPRRKEKARRALQKLPRGWLYQDSEDLDDPKPRGMPFTDNNEEERKPNDREEMKWEIPQLFLSYPNDQ